MIKLYGRIGTGTAAIEALLHELDMPHEYIEVPVTSDTQWPRAPEDFLKLNPLGQVPFISCDDGSTLTESGAMILALADKFGLGKLADHDLYIPETDDPNRHLYIRWILFFASGVYYNHLFYAYSNHYVRSPTAQGELRTNALKELDRLLLFSVTAMGNQKYFLGDECSPLDFYAAMLYSWYPDINILKQKMPMVIEFCHQVMTRPKSKAIWEKHELLQTLS